MPTFGRSRPVGRSLRRPEWWLLPGRVWVLEQRLQKVRTAASTGVYGNSCRSVWPTTRIWNTASSTARWSGPTPALRERPQKRRPSSPGPGTEPAVGISTKVHVCVDSLRNPLRCILTGGQQHDITQAEGPIDGYAGEYVLADKGYDTHRFPRYILEPGHDAGASATLQPEATLRLRRTFIP